MSLGAAPSEPVSEDRLIGWLRRLVGRARVGSPIGDDAAFLKLGGHWAVTVDSQIEGVHFFPGLDPALVARRLLAVNLSDLAASGAEPVWAFLALAASPGFDARRFLRAFVRAARAEGVTLAGGDLARLPQGLVATLTLLGRKPEGGRWLRRAAARPGDSLFVGGTIGESALGQRLLARGARIDIGKRITFPSDLLLPRTLVSAARRAIVRHVQPQPQLALGTALGKMRQVAALDVSDGLARDLHRLCAESKVGATIEAGALPYAVRFLDLCRAVEEDPLRLALSGGEDYVLLFSLPARIAPPVGYPCARIGEITTETSVRIRIDGMLQRLDPLGWDHLT